MPVRDLFLWVQQSHCPGSIPTQVDLSSAGREIPTELSVSGLAMRDNMPSSLSGGNSLGSTFEDFVSISKNFEYLISDSDSVSFPL